MLWMGGESCKQMLSKRLYVRSGTLGHDPRLVLTVICLAGYRPSDKVGLMHDPTTSRERDIDVTFSSS